MNQMTIQKQIILIKESLMQLILNFYCMNQIHTIQILKFFAIYIEFLSNNMDIKKYDSNNSLTFPRSL